MDFDLQDGQFQLCEVHGTHVVLLGFRSLNPHRSLVSMIKRPDHMTVPGHPQVISLNMFWYVETPSVVPISPASTGAGL